MGERRMSNDEWKFDIGCRRVHPAASISIVSGIALKATAFGERWTRQSSENRQLSEFWRIQRHAGFPAATVSEKLGQTGSPPANGMCRIGAHFLAYFPAGLKNRARK